MRVWITWVLVGLGVAGGVLATRVVMEREIVRAAQGQAGSLPQFQPATAIDPSTTPSQAGSSLAFQRVEHLRRGINLSGWYAQAPNYSTSRLDAYMTVADMRTLKRLGFDHVRLSIDPEALIAKGHSGALKPDAIASLDKTVRDLTGAGLNVILDLHPSEEWKVPLARGDEGAQNFFAFWTAFAAHYATTDPEKVFFELLNEPAMDDRYRWAGIQAQAVARVRSVAPRHTVIATAPPYSKIDGLIAIEPVHDEDVIYTFHDYDPMWFTHQGATWAGPGLATLRGVPYPATPENIQPVLGQEPDERERLMLERFAWERWDASRTGAEIAAVDQWARQRGVPLYCGEFGVYKPYSDPEARARWIGDVRTALEARHIGWAMWDYDGGFALMSDDKVVDQNILHALGLGK